MDLSAFFEKEIVRHRPFPACHFLAIDAPKANSRSKSSHMKKLNHTEIQFLELYKSSLWDTPLKDELFASEATDWSRIVEIAKQQTAIACTADALSHLPKDLVPHDLRLQLIGSVLSVQRANEAMNRLLPQLFSLLKAEGIRTWLLKGQGLACHYPAPELRQSGDIDLFFPNLQQFYRAYDLFSQTFRRTEELQPDSLHAAFEYQNIVIELHGKIVLRINRKLDKNFNGWLHNITGNPYDNTIEIAGGQIAIPPVCFDAIFILIHTVRHYFGGGIGLRQVSDWMRFLYVKREEIDLSTLEKDIEKLGLGKIWRVFATMAVELLGCPEEAMPLYRKGKYTAESRKVLRYILDSGNFGQHDKRTKSQSKYYLLRRWKALTGHLKMKFRNVTMFPEEALYDVPNFIKDGLHRTQFWKKR